jgi:hypothetical protein
VEPSPPEPAELLAPPVDDLEELLEDDARSENRLVDPRLAPRLDAAAFMPPVSEPSEDEVLLALLDEVIVIVEALCEVPDEVLLEDDPDEELEPPNTLAEADMALRDEPRLPL